MDWYVAGQRRQESVSKSGMLEITEIELTGWC